MPCKDGGQRSTVPPGSRAQTRWMACGPGSGQRAQRGLPWTAREQVRGAGLAICLGSRERRLAQLSLGSSDVAELKGEEEECSRRGKEREWQSAGGLGPSHSQPRRQNELKIVATRLTKRQ